MFTLYIGFRKLVSKSLCSKNIFAFFKYYSLFLSSLTYLIFLFIPVLQLNELRNLQIVLVIDQSYFQPEKKFIRST